MKKQAAPAVVPDPVQTVVKMADGSTIPATFSASADKALQHPESSDVLKLRKLARDCQEAMKECRSRYVELVRFINVAMFTPMEVDRELLAVGFHKNRISEIKRVAFTSKEILNDYLGRLIGFKAAYEKARRQVRGGDDGAREWLLLFSQFERLFNRSEPPVPHYQGNGRCLVMFSQKDFTGIDKKTVDFDGFRVVVTRLEKKGIHEPV